MLSDIKEMLLARWSTPPGSNFIYAHLNRVTKKRGPADECPGVSGMVRSNRLDGTICDDHKIANKTSRDNYRRYLSIEISVVGWVNASDFAHGPPDRSHCFPTPETPT